jgi:hypothetical protein
MLHPTEAAILVMTLMMAFNVNNLHSRAPASMNFEAGGTFFSLSLANALLHY